MQVVGIFTALGILSIPLALSLNNIAREFRARSVVQSELRGLLADSDRVDTLNVRMEGDSIAVDGVVLVERYAARLDPDLARIAGGKLDRKIDVKLVQLKKQSNAGIELEERLNSRIAALEQRDVESEAILAGLTVGNLLPREQVLLDAQARRVVVERDRSAEGDEVAAAIDRIVASVQADHPRWLIRQGALTPPPAAAE